MYDQINRSYKTNYKTGTRVEYTGGGDPVGGVVTGVASGSAHVQIQLDGETESRNYHPTWELREIEQS